MTTIAAFACLVLKVMDNFSGGRPSVLNTTKTLLKEDGWWGFYRGFGPRFLSMSLYGTTMIVTYELISTFSSHLCIEDEQEQLHVLHVSTRTIPCFRYPLLLRVCVWHIVSLSTILIVEKLERLWRQL